MECELCGRRATKKGKLDGAIVNVCSNCQDYCEKIIEIKEAPVKREIKHEIQEISLDPRFSEKIKKARESRNLTRETLSKQIQEKESIIIRLEQNKMRPTERIARKLEKALNIKILDFAHVSTVHKAQPSEELTLGDIVIVKKKK